MNESLKPDSRLTRLVKIKHAPWHLLTSSWQEFWVKSVQMVSNSYLWLAFIADNALCHSFRITISISFVVTGINERVSGSPDKIDGSGLTWSISTKKKAIAFFLNCRTSVAYPLSFAGREQKQCLILFSSLPLSRSHFLPSSKTGYSWEPGLLSAPTSSCL